MSIRGSPDLILCVNGHFLAIEVKAGLKSKVTELQRYNIHKILESGGDALICYPENMDETLALVRSLSGS